MFVPGNCFYPVTLDNRGALVAKLIECQTLDRKVAGSNLTRGTVLCS